MIKGVLVCFLISMLAHKCSHEEKAAATGEPISADTTQMASVNFTNDIQPILQSHCSPCHFTGGKMYARMPFDKPETIRDHSAGVLRRFKDPEELKKLKSFLKVR